MTISIAYLDEATLVSKEFFAMLHTPACQRFNCQLFVTTNPDSPRHWLKTEYIDRATELGHRVYHFTIDDNAHNLEPGYIADLKAQYSGLWYQRFIEGKWTMAEGVIYSMFDLGRHVTSEQPHAIVKELAIGVDYGARDNTRGIKAVLGDDNRIWITQNGYQQKEPKQNAPHHSASSATNTVGPTTSSSTPPPAASGCRCTKTNSAPSSKRTTVTRTVSASSPPYSQQAASSSTSPAKS